MTDTENTLQEVRLILADVVANSNKFWHARRNADHSVHVEWGRVGEAGQSQLKQFADAAAAEKFIASKRKEKERKGYSEQKTIGRVERVDAGSLVATDDDPVTRKLLDFLVKANIHAIESATMVRFDAGTGTFTTPLGAVTAAGIDEAELILAKMAERVEARDWSDGHLGRLVNEYLRIVPQDVGRRRLDMQALYPDLAAVKAQQDTLDSLRASLVAIENAAKKKGDSAPAHRAKVTLVPDDGAEGSATFRRIQRLYDASRNARHQSAALKLLRVYEIQVNGMAASFEREGKPLGNVMQLWHGTKAANLLSIMSQGFMIPKRGGSIAITGRMFGDGLYFSDQSTKSLNYATGFWGGGRAARSFMLLNDVAMGKAYTPRGPHSRPPAGYDSIFAKAGASGVINNEMVVFKTSQVAPRYLCEFGS